MLTITTQATDLQLLAIEDMRAAAGVTGSGQDAALQAFGLKVAAAITSECNVAVGVGFPPTLRKERLTETLRNVDRNQLILARRHEVSIVSVTVDGTALANSDYEADPESGMLTRLSADSPIRWCASKVTAVYDAGFQTVPDDLKMAASDFFRMAWQESQRDPALKSEEIEVQGVDRVKRDYWVGSVPGQGYEGAVPDIVAGQLKRFRNVLI